MFNHIKIFLLTLLLVLLQISFLSFLVPSFSFSPLLPLLFCLYAVFFLSSNEALFISAVSGFFLDLFSPYFFGFEIFLFIVITYLFRKILPRIFEHKNILAFILLAFFGVVLHQFAHLFITVLYAGPSYLFTHISTPYFYSILRHLLLTAILLSTIYWLFPRFRMKLKEGFIH